MTQIRHDPRIRKTRAAIRDAFIRLMQQKDYDAITVTDISEGAQINRKTFYAHYETKEQLFSQIMEDMFTDMFGAFMYEKPEMTGESGGEALISDAIRFLKACRHIEKSWKRSSLEKRYISPSRLRIVSSETD